jgi:hypothetical protein
MATVTRKVPHSIDYKDVEAIAVISIFVLLFSTITSIFILLIDNDIYIVPTKDKLLTILNSLLSIFALLYFSLDIIQNYLFQKAEEHRRTDFIDNSLGTTLATENSVGYFTNDAITQGLYKMGANAFENSFFTLEVSNKMKLGMVTKSVVIILLFLGIAFFTTHKILAGVLQITLPFTILQQTIKLFLFNSRVKQIFESFKTVLSSSVANKRDQLLTNLVLKYETTLSWGGIPLSGRIFKKYEKGLAQKFDQLKDRYHIS